MSVNQVAVRNSGGASGRVGERPTAQPGTHGGKQRDVGGPASGVEQIFGLIGVIKPGHPAVGELVEPGPHRDIVE